MEREITHVIGVDEAGRGPLAGPVAVGIVLIPRNFDWRLIPDVGDSKKITPRNREAIFQRAQTLKKQGTLNFCVVQVSAQVIDRVGITRSVARGISRGLKKLNVDPACADVRLDGLLKAPPKFKWQKTIIKGDVKEKVIGLASICAKVTRDRTMVRFARTYPPYGFDVHKGYGTQAHIATIRKHGLSKIHRRSFTKRMDGIQ
jgi:ribonuclease HII